MAYVIPEISPDEVEEIKHKVSDLFRSEEGRQQIKERLAAMAELKSELPQAIRCGASNLDQTITL